MACMNVEIRHELRLCEVDGETGYFHTWEQMTRFSDIGGGALAQVFGIVEFKSGVRRIPPTKIKFCDETHATLWDWPVFDKNK